MLVTVISAVCNSENTIARTIESVLNQTYDNIEYIIVDGASTDRTLDIARSYQEAFGRMEGKTLTIVSEPDQGMYDALNKGAGMAHGELVGQINSDDWYETDAVQTMVELYEKEHYAAAWGSVRMCGKNTWIKHAKIGKLWTTTGWCHPGMFSTRDTLIAFPYPIETMYGDFDFITAVHQAKKKIVTVDKVVSNFSFGRSGMSTRKSLKDVKSRVDTTYSIYKKYGMSKLYYWQRWAYEIIKYLVLRPFGQRRCCRM